MKKIPQRNISEEILKYIHKKGMDKGDVLPSERNLAEILKAGRNSVREALKKLEAIDILEIRRGSGCYVKNPDVKHFIYPEVDTVKLALQNIDARLAVEPGIVKLAFERMKTREITQLKSVIVRMSRAVLARDFSAIAAEDNRFLEIIAKAAGNTVLSAIIRELEDSGVHLWKAMMYIPDEKLNVIFGTYVKILNSIQDRNQSSLSRETEIRISLMKKFINDSSKK